MDPNVLCYCVYITECPLQRTTRVQRTRTGTEIEKVDGLNGAVNSMRCSQSNVGARLHRDLTRRDQRPPQPVQGIEQKQPGRAHQRLPLGNPTLLTIVIPKHLRPPPTLFPPT